MNIVDILSSARHLTIDGITSFFWLGCAERGSSTTFKALQSRFVAPDELTLPRGIFSDLHAHLRGLSEIERFEAVIDVFQEAAKKEQDRPWLNKEAAEAISRAATNYKVVIFSYDTAALPCLIAAWRWPRPIRRHRYETEWPFRFSGSPTYNRLMATLAVYVNLPLWVFTAPPWEDQALPDYGPDDISNPDLEIAFPFADRSFDGKPQLIASAKKLGLPRVSVKGKLDVESIAISRSANFEHESIVFVSSNFCSSTGQAKRRARSDVLEGALAEVVAVEASPFEGRSDQISIFVVEPTHLPQESVMMSTVKAVSSARLGRFRKFEWKGRAQKVEYEKLKRSPLDLSPGRYISNDADRSRKPHSAQNFMRPAPFRLADVVDLIRPIPIRSNPNGDIVINQISARDVSRFGLVEGLGRELSIEDTKIGKIEAFRIRENDIVLAHRTRVGRAIIPYHQKNTVEIYASQDFTILRPRRLARGHEPGPTCDPRILFMHLISPDIQGELRKRADANGRVVPMGELERLAVPEAFVSHPNISVGEESTGNDEYDNLRQNVLMAFDDRLRHISELTRIQRRMAESLRDAMHISDLQILSE